MFTFLLITGAMFVILGIGGIIADHVFPHIKHINKFIDNLPLMWDK